MSEIPSTAFGRDENLNLYELFPIAEFAPNEHPPRPTPPPHNATNPSYTTIPRRFFKNVATRLVRTLDGLVISPTVPPALVQLLPLVRSRWSLQMSRCGNHLAVLQDDVLEIRSKSAGFGVTAAIHLLDRDGFPSWRRVVWSFDSRLLALSGSNGAVQVVSVDGTHLCLISSKTKEATDGNADVGGLPTRPVLVDWKEVGVGDGGRDPVGLIDPISTMLFLRPGRGTADSCSGDFEFEGGRYSHELLTITYDGILRSYLINANNLGIAAKLASSSDASFIPLLAGPRRPTVGLAIPREGTRRQGEIIFYHKFSFRHWHSCVCAAVVDIADDVLWVGGKGGLRPNAKRHAHDNGKNSPSGTSTGYLSEWRLTARKPYYQMKGVEMVDPSVIASAEEGDKGLWTNIRKVLTIDSVLTSLRPSRRRVYLETIHCMSLAPDGKHLLTLDCGGSLKLWRPPQLDVVQEWGPEELMDMALGGQGLDASENESATVRGAGAAVSGTVKVISVGWWSNSSVVLTFEDGIVAISNLPGMQNLLGSPEKFHPCPSVVSIRGERLFILEHEMKSQRVRLRNGVYSPMRAETDDADDEQAAELDAVQKGIVERAMSMMASPLRLFTSTFLWHWEDQTSPSRRIVKVQKRKYRLMCLLKTTPLEAMRRKIALGDYTTALELAAKFDLDKDEVYKAQWLQIDVSEATIRDFLGKIRDRQWVLHQCLDRIPPSGKAAKLLLQYGLKQTNFLTLRDVEAEIEAVLEQLSGNEADVGNSRESLVSNATQPEGAVQPSTMDLCLFRIQFLKYLDRLDTHEAIYAGTQFGSGGPEFGDQPTAFAEHFAWFRDADLVAQAVDFAIDENLAALEQLFTRHGSDVLPCRLSILSHLPETADPTSYKHLLPRIDQKTGNEAPWVVIPWRKPDWTKSDTVLEFVGLIDDEDHSVLGVPQPLPGIERRDYPASASVISKWYATRSREIEARSGQIDFALDLVRLGMHNGVKGLTDLHENLMTLSSLVYECCDPMSTVAVDMSLEKLQGASDTEIIRLFLADSDASKIVRDIRRFVMPYVERVAKRLERQSAKEVESEDNAEGTHKQGPQDLLWSYLVEIGPTKLDWISAIVENSRHTLPDQDRIIQSDRTLAELVLECAYRCARTDQLDILYRMMRSLPSFGAGLENGIHAPPVRQMSSWEEDMEDLGLEDDHLHIRRWDPNQRASSPSSDFSDIRTRLQLFEAHLEASEILMRYGLPKPLSWFLEAQTSADVQRQLMVLLARQSTGDEGVQPDEDRFENEDEWSGLLDNMLELWRLGVLAMVPKRDIYVEFLSVALSNGRFELAKRIMQPDRGLPPLPIEVSEKLVIDAAREFYDNAEDGDMYRGYLKKSWDCLKVLPASPALKIELDLIEATHALTTRYQVPFDLRNPHLHILPIQIRLHADRLDLIRSVLKRHPRACASSASLLDLAKKLVGAAGWTTGAQARVRAMVADAAIDAGDHGLAYTMCEELITNSGPAEGIGGGGIPTARRGSVPSAAVGEVVWTVCVRLAKETDYRDLEGKAKLLGHALTVCPKEKVGEVLDLWRKVEAENISTNALLRARGIIEGRDDDMGSLVCKPDGRGKGGRVFDYSKAVDELRRGVLGFEDRETPIGSPERNIALHEFYKGLADTHDGPVPYGVDDYKVLCSAKGSLLEALLRVEWLWQHGESVSDRMEFTDADILESAMEAFELNVPLALRYLLDLPEDSKAERFFSALYPSPDYERLASYYYAVRAVSCFLADDPIAMKALYNYPISQVVQAVQHLGGSGEMAQTRSESGVKNEIVDVAGDWGDADVELDLDLDVNAMDNANQPTNVVPVSTGAQSPEKRIAETNAAAIIQRALHHASQVHDKHREQAVLSMLDERNVDMVRFKSDEAYRKRIACGWVRRSDERKVEEAVGVAAEVGIEKWEMMTAHIEWLFESPTVDASLLRARLEQNDAIIRGHPGPMLAMLTNVHQKVDGTLHEKLTILYQTCMQLSDQLNENAQTQLKMRVGALQALQHKPSLKSIDLKKAIAANTTWDPAGAYTDMWKVIGTKESLDDFADAVPGLLDLRPLNMFPDEAELSSTFMTPDWRTTVSTMYSAYAIAKLPSVPWDYLDDERISRDVSELEALLENLMPKDLAALTQALTVGEQALGIPVSLRNAVAVRAEQVIMHSVEAKITDAETIQSEILAIRRHLQMIAELGAISDVNTGEHVAPERLRQFDEGFGADSKQLAIICMRMIIAGTSPSIVNDICQTLARFFPTHASLFSTSSLYAETVRCIVAAPTDPAFGKVFRRGIDSPIAALDRIVTSVVEYVVTEEPGLDVNVGGEDGWGIAEDLDLGESATAEMIAGLEKTLRDELGAVVEDAARFGADMSMEVLNLLQRRFVVEQGDAHRFQLAKLGSIVKGAWDIDINESPQVEPADRRALFVHLLGKTHSGLQAQSLVAILAEWMPAPTAREGDQPKIATPAHLQQCWCELFFWMAQHGEMDMMMLTRVEFEAYDLLSESGEGSLLDVLKDVSMTEYYKNVLLSSREWLASSAGPDLRARLLECASSSSTVDPSLLSDRTLHTLLCARGMSFEFVGTPMWPHIRITLLSGSAAHSTNPSAGQMLVSAVVSDLISAGHMSAAAELTFGYIAAPVEASSGLGMRFGILKRFLGQSESSHPSTGGAHNSETRRHVEEKIVERFLDRGVRRIRGSS
ncbi:hypothetical protein HK104_000885 [Borealophlyctis nickersoniae]|nr:hypothetical protein HK104_000885 [Borealophlyctis nickersoniae]